MYNEARSAQELQS